jgi:hypothetical protein
MFMYSLNHKTDERKRLGFANPNLINQIKLNPQTNENNLKYKNMRTKSQITLKKELTNEKRIVVATYLRQTMLWFQDKACIMAPYNFK